MTLSKSEIEACLAYCRWLHMRAFSAWMKDRLGDREASSAKNAAGVCLNGVGERVYAQVLAEVKAIHSGGVMLLETERKEVVKYLADLKDGRKATTRPVAHGPVRHAKLELTGITKFTGGGKRTIRGVANSGKTDRMGDIVEPKGGHWTLPVPLLWQHKHDQPIGWVRAIDVRPEGLVITAELAEGIGKADEAWRMVEAGLVDSYSIGFQAEEFESLPNGGRRFTSWALYEISIVTVPADPRAKIRREAHGNSRTAGVKLRPANGAVRLVGSSRGGR